MDWVVFNDIELTFYAVRHEEDDPVHPQHAYYHKQECKMLHLLIKSGMLGPSSEIMLTFNHSFVYIKEMMFNVVTWGDVDLLSFDWLNVPIIQVWELFLRDTYATFFQTPAIFSFLCSSKIAGQGIQKNLNLVAQYVGDAFIAEGKKPSTEQTKYMFAPYIKSRVFFFDSAARAKGRYKGLKATNIINATYRCYQKMRAKFTKQGCHSNIEYIPIQEYKKRKKSYTIKELNVIQKL